MGWLEIIVVALKLVWGILQEVFAAKKRARAEEKAFKLTKEIFWALAQDALDKMRSGAKQDSEAAQSIEDKVDAELQKKE